MSKHVRYPGCGVSGLSLGSIIAGAVFVLSVSQVASAGELAKEASANTARDRKAEEAVQFLQTDMERSDHALRDLEGRMPTLRESLRQLLKQTRAIRPPDRAKKPSARPEPPRQVEYRPPMEQRTTQKAIIFACKERGIGFIDLKVVNRRLREIRASRNPKTAKRERFKFDLPGSGFQCEGFIEGRLGAPAFKEEATIDSKPGCFGENGMEIQRPGSCFRRALQSHRPGRFYVSFGVWPDSYEVFRKARSLAWEAGYDVGWVPLATGEPIELGSGPGVIQ